MRQHLLMVAGVLVAAEIASALGLRVRDTPLYSQPGEEVDILVTGSGHIKGVNLYIQLGDGGVLAGGTDWPGVTVPAITDVRFDGGVWGPVGPEAANVEIFSGVLAYASCLAPGSGVTVTGPGKIATLILDDRGVVSGAETLVSLEISAFGARSDFLDLPADELIPGITISGVPEPAALLLLTGGLVMAGGRRPFKAPGRGAD